jgi:hypothetical protein
MTQDKVNIQNYVHAIKESRLTIYDPIEINHPTLWIPTPVLETLLDNGLKGISLADLPLRTRSRVVKEHVCRVLGYPIPKSFKKVQPRFPCQNLDTYTQKANNLQIWNEEISPTRRYALIRTSAEDIITKVKVVHGDILAILDTTGTLTQKYQAQCIPSSQASELISNEDTKLLKSLLHTTANIKQYSATPLTNPVADQLLPIKTIFDSLIFLIGARFSDTGYDQERNRGGMLHRIVCKALGYSSYQDDGRFPDIRHQLLEVKLQTSRTIDLGLVRPDSTEILDVPKLNGQQVRHCDVRYVIFYGETDGKQVTLTNLFVTTGEMFFKRFPQFQGKVINKKLQIPLPGDFFDG